MLRSLEHFRPPPRFDQVAWQQARVEEAPPTGSPWTALATLNLTPIDSDPATPAWRSFTVTNAALEPGLYRVVWIDAFDLEAPSDAVGVTATGTPAADDIRQLSRVDFDALDLAVGADGSDPLDTLVARALAYVLDVCGYDTITDVPVRYGVLLVECVQLRTEQLAYQLGEDLVETGAEELIASTSAGSWSESKRSLKELAELRMINRWPTLNDALWRLCTEEKRAWWLALWDELNGGEPPPAFGAVDLYIDSPPGSLAHGSPSLWPWP